MTPAQRIAISNACLLAGQTVNPLFRSQSGLWSTVLTVNTGYE